MAKYKLRWPITRDECDECGHTSTRLRRPWRKLGPPQSRFVIDTLRGALEYNSPIFSREALVIIPYGSTVAVPRVGEFSFAEKS